MFELAQKQPFLIVGDNDATKQLNFIIKLENDILTILKQDEKNQDAAHYECNMADKVITKNGQPVFQDPDIKIKSLLREFLERNPKNTVFEY